MVAKVLNGLLEPFEQSNNLDLLEQVSQDFASSYDIHTTLENALRRVAAALGAEAASLFLLENEHQELVCRAAVGPVDVLHLRIDVTMGIVGRCVREQRSQLIRDARKDPSFTSAVDQRTGFETRSILAAPLNLASGCLGCVELINKKSGDGLFSESDRQVLQTLSAAAALAINNARLTAQIVEQESLKRELKLAREIQRSLLPRDVPVDYPIRGLNIPARGVSGDFFDVFPLSDGRIAFNIGDVSGKGINAALLMSKVSSLYRCLGKAIDDPGTVIGRLNREICETATRGMFVTIIGGLYDPKNDIVKLVNAGHLPALYRSPNGRFEMYGAKAPPLGITADENLTGAYPVVEFQLMGGCLSLFTDGLTEGRSANGSELGIDGYKTVLNQHITLPLSERLELVVERMGQVSNSFRDDVTLVMVEQR